MRFLFTFALALSISCGPPVMRNPTCCQPVTIARDFGYLGTYSSDGGVTTQVQVIVSATTGPTASFTRGTDQVVERFR